MLSARTVHSEAASSEIVAFFRGAANVAAPKAAVRSAPSDEDVSALRPEPGRTTVTVTDIIGAGDGDGDGDGVGLPTFAVVSHGSIAMALKKSAPAAPVSWKPSTDWSGAKTGRRSA